ncbi:hypothetical protein [Pleomorphomonas carboxyditropha]|uniref:Uncharacterized protein n=1 Tax=Pleomorphomonas carboxyditropha TaxID=2023338 RepID=A0A2G9WVC4_9HYPH|nr:hypothetical protein [Pleomorphomonas carboxyditropha]PIO98623.1 hypothetical protein CJ014_15005 [Pleomorphomonas carboxyditropha]
MLLVAVVSFFGLVIVLTALRISSGWIFGEARSAVFWGYVDATNKFLVKLFIVALGFFILAVIVGHSLGWL